MIKIFDLLFRIKSAVLEAYIDEENMEIVWGVEIEGEPCQQDFSRWEPSLVSESLFRTKKGELNTWRDIAEKSTKWDSPYDLGGKPYATLYVFEHEPIYNCNVKLYSKSEELHFYLNGQCDVNWDSKYGKNLDLKIDCKIEFSGIWFRRESEINSRKLLSQFCTESDFSYTLSKNGISLMVPK